MSDREGCRKKRRANLVEADTTTDVFIVLSLYSWKQG